MNERSGALRWLAAVALALAALMACGAAGADGDAEVENFEAEVVVTRDGALEFTERLTYYVTDGINGFTRDLDPSFGSGIADFGVRLLGAADGEFSLDEGAREGDSGVFYSERLDNGLVRYYIYLPCEYGDRVTLEYSYALPGVCARYRDVGVIDFPLLGDGWEMDIERYSARVSFEQGAASDIDLRINSAGMALDEAATGARDGCVYFSGADAGDGGDALRVRIMFPAELLDGMDYTQDVDMAETILRQEAELDALTLANRQYGIIWLCAIALVCAALCAAAYRLWGRDPRVEADKYHTGEPLPLEEGVTPAEISAALGMGADQDALAATMLDLVRRGYLRLEGGEQLAYVYDGQALDGCAPHEQYALNLIIGMGEGGRATLEDVKRNSRRNRYVSGFSEWTGMVRASARARGWWEARSGAQKLTGAIAIGASMLLLGVGIWSACRGSAYEALGVCQILGAVALLLGGVFALAMNKRTPEGARVAGEWNSVRAWLKGDWDARELPPDADLMEQLMVYALALGMSGKLAAKLDALDPSYAQAMVESGRAMRMFDQYGDVTGMAAYGYYCACAHSSMRVSGGSSGGSVGGGAGGGGGGGTF